MTIWAIVPVKPFNRAKSRLAPVLAPEAREMLAAEMLRHTVSVLVSSDVVNGVLVISRDSRALLIARKYGAKTVQEGGIPALNPALERACQMISSWNARAALILPADLPLLTPADVHGLAEIERYRPSVTITPDFQEVGTNALLLRPPDIVPCQFGEDSFRLHVEAAHAAGIEAHIYRSERLMLDLDTPEDLLLYLQLCQKYGVQPLIDLSLEQVLPSSTASDKEKP